MAGSLEVNSEYNINHCVLKTSRKNMKHEFLGDPTQFSNTNKVFKRTFM